MMMPSELVSEANAPVISSIEVELHNTCTSLFWFQTHIAGANSQGIAESQIVGLMLRNFSQSGCL